MAQPLSSALGTFLFLVLLAALSASASAQGGRSSREARELFERGTEALAASEFGIARELFQRSLALHPNAGTAFNLGVALQRSGELTRADRLFAELLTGEFGTLSANQRRQVRRLRTELTGEMSTLRLELRATTDAPLEVRIDGVFVEASAPQRLDPGEHVITVRGTGYHPLDRSVVLRRGESRELVLEPERLPDATVGRLIVEAPAPDHWIEVVGVERAQGRVDVRLEEGTYRVILRSGDTRREQEVEVVGGRTERLSLGLLGRRRPWRWVGPLLGALVLGGVALGIGIGVARAREPIRDDTVGLVTAFSAR